MCGICGTYKTNTNINDIIKKLHHRGPDSHGIKHANDVTHGHTRLSILDLTNASNQPYTYQNGTLSYNGELWNYTELREELRALGHAFRTTGDTEVVAAALSEWGADALARFDGMFALCWSRGTERILARDVYGRVPLYAMRLGRGFVWASERKGLPKGGRATAVPPGSFVDLTTGRVHAYYELAARPDGNVLAMLRDGVRKRLQSDAPVCALISGGLDSTLTLALMLERGPVTAFTAVYDTRSTDLAVARRVCKDYGVTLHEVEVPRPTPESIEAAAYAIEIPTKAQVEIAVLCLPLASAIRAEGFKVVLSGEAADEIFGGYGNLIIKAARATDEEWRALRHAQLAKMARGNFVRCNKVFMAAGVEARLPFTEQPLVEHVLTLGKRECPPGKGLLKQAARGIVPDYVIKRPKDTFQGASGVRDAIAGVISNPTRYYNATIRRQFSALTRD